MTWIEQLQKPRMWVSFQPQFMPIHLMSNFYSYNGTTKLNLMSNFIHGKIVLIKKN
jgi:hypothetical protein